MISVSSMAFGHDAKIGSKAFSKLARRFRSCGISGIEMVPPLQWPGWLDANPFEAGLVRSMLADDGMCCPALQSILFGVEGACLFAGGDQGRAKLADHILIVAELAAALGAPVMVLGSPQLRQRGGILPAQALQIATAFLHTLAERLSGVGVSLCIEPNARAYGCDFITTLAEGESLVRLVGHPNFGLHFDTGGSLMEHAVPAEEAAGCTLAFRHVHVSEPHLIPFDPRSAVSHLDVRHSLERLHYGGWVSLEMRRADLDTVLSIAQSFAAIYGTPCPAANQES